MNEYLVIATRRNGYGPDQVGRTLTVGELKELLEDYDDDTLVVTSHDNEYTFGSIESDDLESKFFED